jgi:hypothetical protein
MQIYILLNNESMNRYIYLDKIIMVHNLHNIKSTVNHQISVRVEVLNKVGISSLSNIW